MAGNWHYLLECPVQNYDWGNTEPDGLIQSLVAPSRPVPAGKPAAELWMGAHPSGPARVIALDGTLPDLIDADPAHWLGPELAQRGVRTLPFLFKILDARKPLSIQAHPDKAGAERLHADDPAHYPDDNHKPELAVCLRDMRALVGFRPVEQIKDFLDGLPELARLCETDADVDGSLERDWIRARYGAMMRASADRIDSSARYLLRREDKQFRLEYELFARLVELYGTRDSGIFSVFFLNLVELKFGEGIFLGPNEPHAYLSGQILECMAASDNVVRAGLTPKFIDLETLLDMLHYRPGLAEILKPRGTDGIESYPVPVADFQVRRWRLSEKNLIVKDHDRPSILIVLQGEARIRARGPDLTTGPDESSPALKPGNVVFLPGDLASRAISLEIEGSSDALVYQATVAREFGAS